MNVFVQYTYNIYNVYLLQLLRLKLRQKFNSEKLITYNFLLYLASSHMPLLTLYRVAVYKKSELMKRKGKPLVQLIEHVEQLNEKILDSQR